MMRSLYITALFSLGCSFEPVVEGTSEPVTLGCVSGPCCSSAPAPCDTTTTSGATDTTAADTTTTDTTTTNTTATNTTATNTTATNTTATNTTATDTTAANTSTGTAGAEIEIEGGITFPSDCEPLDLDCGARTACEAVTGIPCVKQNYDCLNGGAGLSYFPQGGGGMDSFNFGAYVLTGSFGNICACDTTNWAAYSIPQLYDPCGEGNWRFVQ